MLLDALSSAQHVMNIAWSKETRANCGCSTLEKGWRPELQVEEEEEG